MILDTTTKSLELILGSAVTTNAMPVTVDYVDMTTTTTLPGSSDSQSNGATLVTILAAPAASTQRKVNTLMVYNADTAAKVVTVRLNNNTVLRQLIVVTLAVGYTLGYTDIEGWYVNDASGQRTLSMPGYAPVAGSASQTFSVAAGTGSQAVNKTQADAAYAALNGSSSNAFSVSVLNATEISLAGSYTKTAQVNGLNVANNAYIDFTFTSGGAGFMAWIMASSASPGNALIATRSSFSGFGRGASAVFTQLATQNGTSAGAGFTITYPTDGTIRMTNTSGFATNLRLHVTSITTD